MIEVAYSAVGVGTGFAGVALLRVFVESPLFRFMVTSATMAAALYVVPKGNFKYALTGTLALSNVIDLISGLQSRWVSDPTTLEAYNGPAYDDRYGAVETEGTGTTFDLFGPTDPPNLSD